MSMQSNVEFVIQVKKKNLLDLNCPVNKKFCKLYFETFASVARDKHVSYFPSYYEFNIWLLNTNILQNIDTETTI